MLWIGKGMAGAQLVGVRWVWATNLGHRRDDFPGHAHSFAGVVPRHVVGDDPEERGERVGTAASAGTEGI
jgi:hypothetical protein